MGNNQMFLENGNTDTLILNDTAFSAEPAIEKHNLDPQAHPYLLEQLSAKQDTLTAGTGISIIDNEISCTQASAEWGNITGTLSDQTDLQAALDAKQATLSGAQLNAVNSGIDSTKVAQIATNTGNITTNSNSISAIEGKIPSQASSSNKLADKDFVNSSIATNTANFIGTFNSVAELEAYAGTVTNNDYAFVVNDDSAGNTLYDRYKYNGSTEEWLFEYELNNSSFTAEQWAALNSGITSSDVSAISDAQPKTLVTPITVGGVSQTTVEGALGAINTNTDGALKNTATGTNSLTILGTAVSYKNGVNIGIESETAQGSVAVGWHAQVKRPNAVAVGSYINVNNTTGVAIGNGCTINAPSGTYMIALGTETSVTADRAIQIGQGTNSTANSLQVWDKPLLDGTTGLIPSDRIPTASSSVKGGVKIAFDSGTGVLNIITE